ncbi:hypothetical protein [Treponema denticola]|uniref:hypothetical protein n=1 Tax=Treponema denticola TaxID=158 RepID=UPI0020A43A9B|nr:hypothetical protein [Treponema denticola]UTC86615.1 hypothetical protein E4N79_12875 [Treponema denticola]
MIQNVILLEKNLNFSSKTTRQNKKNEYTTPPPPRIFCKYADNYCVTSQKLVLDVQKARLRVIFVRALYLPRLFAKRPVTFGKQHNFFTTNQLSHKTRKKIFRFIYQNVLFGLGQFNPNKIKYIESPNLKLAGIPKGRALWQRGKEREGFREREETLL